MKNETRKRNRETKYKTTYETGKAFKFAEEDVFNEGCIPGSGGADVVYIEFIAPTLNDLILKVKDYWGLDTQDLQLNNDDVGHLEFQIYEDMEGNKATDNDIEQWKQGKKRLWLVCYTYRIEKVKRSYVDLKGVGCFALY